MAGRRWLIIPASIILLAGTLLLAACEVEDPVTYPPPPPGDDDVGPRDPGLTVGPALGQLAPDFTLVDTGGVDRTLSSYRGQVVVLFFWFMGCPYCEQELAGVQAIHTDHAGDVQVLGLNFYATASQIETYLAGFGCTFPNLLCDPAVQSAYGITEVPHSLVIDTEGVVRFNGHTASVTDALLQGLI
ncbi:MAG: TlpA disulfide reductase family protein [Candidatus Krumholzibacteriia bacterium]